jgi:hypothetical protein
MANTEAQVTERPRLDRWLAVTEWALPEAWQPLDDAAAGAAPSSGAGSVELHERK